MRTNRRRPPSAALRFDDRVPGRARPGEEVEHDVARAEQLTAEELEQRQRLGEAEHLLAVEEIHQRLGRPLGRVPAERGDGRLRVVACRCRGTSSAAASPTRSAGNMHQAVGDHPRAGSPARTPSWRGTSRPGRRIGDREEVVLAAGRLHALGAPRPARIVVGIGEVAVVAIEPAKADIGPIARIADDVLVVVHQQAARRHPAGGPLGLPGEGGDEVARRRRSRRTAAAAGRARRRRC